MALNNSSLHSTAYRLDSLNEPLNVNEIVTCAMGSLLLVSNAVMLIFLIKSSKMKETHSLLIASLCVADGLAGLALILLSVVPVMILSSQCKAPSIIADAFLTLTTISAQWHTVSLSIDRLVAVQFALRYHVIMTRYKIILLLVSSWIIGTVEGFVSSYMYACGDNPLEDSMIMIIINTLLVLFINACIYTHLWRVARRQRRQIAQLQQQQQQTAVVDKATVMVIIIVVAFGVLWAPYLIMVLISIVGGGSEFETTVMMPLFLVAYGNGLINCVVYVAMNKKICNRNCKITIYKN